MKRQQPERLIQNAIIEYLLLKGHFVWRNVNRGWQLPSGQWKPSTVQGVPDVIGVEKSTGRFIGIEVKAKGGKLTSAQQNFIDLINKKGGLAIVAYSIDEVMKIL